MNHHIDTSKADHDILLLTSVKELKVNSQQKDLEIAQLKEWNTKKDESINMMKQNFEDLKNEVGHVRVKLSTQIENIEEKVKQKDLEIAQLKKWNTKKDESINLMNQNLQSLKSEFDAVRVQFTKQIAIGKFNESQQIKQNKENIENLQKFADTISDLHLTLSNKWIRRNGDHISTLFQSHYDEDRDVEPWNNFVKTVNENEIINCDYLEKLKDSINQYSENYIQP